MKQSNSQENNLIQSMTGFGSAEEKEKGFLVRVDLRTVNNRYFKINSKVPEVLFHLAGPAESFIRNSIPRGTVFMTIRCEPLDNSTPIVNENLLDSYIQTCCRFQEKNDLSGNISVSELLTIPGVVCSSDKIIDNTILESVLQQALEKALSALLDMRKKEGLALKTEMIKRNKKLVETLNSIENQLPQALKQVQENLSKRVSDLLKKKEIQLAQTDLAREIAILAEKTDVAEELERLRSHITQMSALFEKGGRIGRQLDFLTQEMLREVTTMSAKVGTTYLAELVLELKVEIDRVKEQAQNIE